MSTSQDLAAAALAQLMREQSAALRQDDQAEPLSVDDALSHGAGLRGKVVVVTGSGAGFGASYARTVAKFGAKLVLSDRNEGGVLAVAEEIKAAGGEATAIKCDVTKWEDQVKMFRHGVNTFGHIDVVVANAGISEPHPLMDLTEGEDGEPQEPKMTTLDVNVKGVMYTIKLAFFHLKNNPVRDGKCITILGSLASFFGIPGAPAYTTSKHAVLGLMRSLAYDADMYNITINTVHPFFVLTNIFSPIVNLLLAGIPLPTVDEVVATMVAASSMPRSSGAAFVVDFKGILKVPRHLHETGSYYRVFMDRATGAMSTAKWLADSVRALISAVRRGRLA
ncbi:hypothetical protein JCM8097_008621 [Rhodosporidiobolus ruineniae]